MSKTRVDYILNFYSTMKTEYDFMMWVRNIRRVNKYLFCPKQTERKSENQEKHIDDRTAYVDCIKSFLKLGERYVSLFPSKTNVHGVPIFFTLKKLAEELVVTYVEIRFIKCGDGSAQFIPEWENVVGDMVMNDENLYNIRVFDQTQNYCFANYLEIRNDVMMFYYTQRKEQTSFHIMTNGGMKL